MTTRFTLKAAASALALAISIGAASAQDRVSFDIESQPLSRALLEFNEQSGLTVAAPSDLVNGRTAPAVEGSLEPSEALTLLLADSGLSVRELPSGALTIVASDVEQTEAQSESFRAASLAQEAARVGRQPVEESSRDDQSDERADDEEERDVITVTGTNIRGVTPDSSPTIVFDREDIEVAGVSTLAEFVQTIPQSFGGGPQTGTLILPSDRTANSNFTEASSINLRGLGSGATLVLLNGRRVAPAGTLGSFVDISMIPLSAVERIEIVLDGASAIYGADAVGGVVNIILRDDYVGAQLFGGIGGVTDGDMLEHRAGGVYGRAWGTGNILGSYEYFERDSLSVLDRAFSQAEGAPNVLLPNQDSHSVLVSLSQDLGERFTLSADVNYSERSISYAGRLSFQTDTSLLRSRSEQAGVALGISGELSSEWAFEIRGNYSTRTDANETYINSEDNLQQRRKVNSDLWSFDASSNGPVFTVPAGDVRMALGMSYREESFRSLSVSGSRLTSVDDADALGVFGELFVPIFTEENRRAGLERLELTLAGRFDDYSAFGSQFSPKVGLLWSPLSDLKFRATYSESYNAPSLGDSGSQRATVLARIAPNNQSPTGSSIVIVNTTAPDLGPETATSWTAGVDYSAEVGNRVFNLSATWFDTSYIDRIDSPGSFREFLNNRSAFESLIIENPSPDQVRDLVENPDFSFLNLTGGAWTMVGDEEFILDQRITNLATQNTSGIDILLEYDTESELGEFSYSLSLAHIFEQSQKITPTSDSRDVIDTIFYPSDWRIRGSASWSRNIWTAALFINYTDSYTDNRNLGGSADVTIDSWTTVDASLRLESSEQTPINILHGTTLSLNVQNLFDVDPPRIEGGTSFFGRRGGFDPANANPLGRFVTVRLTKSW